MDSFLLPSSLKVVDVQDTPNRLVVTVQDTREYVCCPSCGQPSRRIHSHYLRVTQDTAVGDRAVEVHLHVRRLRCDTATCSHLTFAETWPDWLDARVQRTSRLAQVQRSVGMALGGEAGKRLLTLLHEGTSGDTLLRLIRMQDLPEHPPPRVLGVDDFCFRRGKTYGTLLIDLERHQAVDVLPDRKAQTLADWLTAHPGIEIISRDRYGDYARGAAIGAPNAQQIADRFHLIKNLREVSEHWLKRLRMQLPLSEPPTAVAVDPASLGPVAHPFKQDAVPNSTSARVARAQGRRDHRLCLYERAAALHAQGHSVAATARLTGVGRSTLQGWFKTPHFPGRATRPSAILPFLDVVRERVSTAEFTGKQIYDELVLRGYTGSLNAVYDALEWLRQGHLPPAAADRQPDEQTAPVPASKPFSAKRGSWWFIQAPEKLSQLGQAQLALLQTTAPISRTVYSLVQDFASLLRTRPLDASARLTAWIEHACASTVLELERFASGIQKDAAAVLGAIMSPWSNGQVEGQVTRVKLLKRQMYGRAKFDLLRARILLA